MTLKGCVAASLLGLWLMSTCMALRTIGLYVDVAMVLTVVYDLKVECMTCEV